MQLPQSQFFKKKLSEKVKDAVWEDKRKYKTSNLKIAGARKVIEGSSGRCENCGCELLFDGWLPWCLHQFSLDRVDLTQPHGEENMRLLCYCCNAQIANKRDSQGRVIHIECPKCDCSKGCHVGTVPRAPPPLPLHSPFEPTKPSQY